MATIRKATDAEKTAYAAGNKVYPLYGYVKYKGVEYAVEYLGEGPGNPNYEIIAPEGQHFYEGTHTLLCTTLAEVKERAQGTEPCTEQCK